MSWKKLLDISYRNIAFAAVESNQNLVFRGFQSVYAVDPLNSQILWETELVGDIEMGFKVLAAGDGFVFAYAHFGNDKGVEVYCLASETGSIEWKKKMDIAPHEGAFEGENGFLYFGGIVNGENSIVKFDGKTGNYNLIGCPPSLLLLKSSPEALFLAGKKGLWKMDLEQGKFECLIDLPIWEIAVCENAILFTYSPKDQGGIFANGITFSAREIGQPSRIPTTNFNVQLSSIGNQCERIVYVPGMKKGLTALDLLSGKEIWQVGEAEEWSIMGFQVLRDSLMVLCRKPGQVNELIEIDLQNGKILSPLDTAWAPNSIFWLGSKYLVVCSKRNLEIFEEWNSLNLNPSV